MERTREDMPVKDSTWVRYCWQACRRAVVARRSQDIPASRAQRRGPGHQRDVGAIAKSAHWTLTSTDAGQRIWTDDYSNIAGAFWRKISHQGISTANQTSTQLK